MSGTVVYQSSGGQIERDLHPTYADAEASLRGTLNLHITSLGNTVAPISTSARDSHFRVTSPSGHLVGEYWIEL